MNYSFTEEEKEFLKQFNFSFSVDKNMTDEELFEVIKSLEDFIQLKGIGEDDEENELGYIASTILTKMAHEDDK